MKAGQWYKEVVFRTWVKNGPSWITATKRVIEHGPREKGVSYGIGRNVVDFMGRK